MWTMDSYWELISDYVTYDLVCNNVVSLSKISNSSLRNASCHYRVMQFIRPLVELVDRFSTLLDYHSEASRRADIDDAC